MAYIRKQRGKWRAEIERNGVRASKTFLTKAEATSWAAAEETRIRKEGAGFPPHTFLEALDAYEEKVSAKKEGSRAEGMRLRALAKGFPDLVAKQLTAIDTPDWAAWRDERLKTVTAGSVQRDINLFRNVFSIARDEWKWCGHNPFKGLRMPGDNPPRDRRVQAVEVKRVCRWLGYRTGRVETKYQEVAIAFLIGLRTAMREGEIVTLSDATVDLKKRVARVPHKTQYLTGKPREIPLTRPGVRLLGYLAGRGKYFHITAESVSTLFRKARDSLGIEGLNFHDSRAEALTRLSRKVDVMTLARISGHKDLRVLMESYYRESAEDIASRI